MKDYINFYKRKKFSLTPLNGKIPILQAWTTEQISEQQIQTYFFELGHNIGVVLGEASGGIVDVDLDNDVARQLAPAILPATGMKFGRSSAPAGHYIYRVSSPGKTQRFSSNAHGTLIELRSEGGQTMFPGSRHPETEEAIEFEFSEQPATIAWADLKQSVEEVAVATILVNYWRKGARHNLALAISGMMANAGRNLASVKRLVSAVSRHCQDDEPEDRDLCVSTTFEAHAEGKPIAGYAALTDLVGSETAKLTAKWIGLTALAPGNNNVSADSDAGRAKIFADENRGSIYYASLGKEWYRKERGILEIVTIEGMQRQVVNTGCSLIVKGKIPFPNASKFSSVSGIANILTLARSELAVDSGLFDIDDDLAGCRDGVLSLDESRLIEPGAALITKRLGVNFRSDEKCPHFEGFLGSVFQGDVEVIKFVQRAVGYTLSGETSEQCLFVLVGNGANGKSTLMNVLAALFGDYSGTTPMQMLMVQRYGNQASNDLAALVGKRFVSASEGEAGAKLAEAKIKSMTGGDPITCRKLYQDFFEYQPRFKLWLATNDLPRIDGTSEGIWRRFNVIEFPVTFAPNERDKTLPAKLKRELSGILNWALEGHRNWKAEGLNPPAKIMNATAAYRGENDTICQFIDACCDLNPTAGQSTAELFAKYEQWCSLSGIDPRPKVLFGKELGRQGLISYRHAAGNGWKGIALKDEAILY
ncbi:phage/plasmid primase, P4 family [Mesorhizobium sp. M0030]|uniref:phage/plasmid primase, P4 family n=1 Tax=Mesorhizobium sp. M0030 TaxID=2956851 RepID=UPI003338CAD1